MLLAWLGARLLGLRASITGSPRQARFAQRIPFGAILVIAGIALALRLPWGTPEPMDHLEYALVVEVKTASSLLELIANRVGIEQAHQPLSRLPIAAVLALGARPEAVRWIQLAAWMGALGFAASLIPRLLTGLGSRELDTDRTPSLATCAFAWLAWSPLGVRYGFDVTPYGLLALFSWGSLWALFRRLEGAGWGLGVATLLALLAFYTHYIALWFFAGSLAYLWLELASLPADRSHAARLDLVVVGSAFGIGIVPWLPAMRAGVALFDAYVSREKELYALDFSWLAQTRELARIALGLMGWPSLLVAVGLPLLALVVGRRPSRGRLLPLAVPLALFELFRAYQLRRYEVAAGGTYFGARHFIPFLVFLIPVVTESTRILGEAISAARSSRGRRAAMAVLAVLPLAASSSSIHDHIRPQRPDVRAAAERIRAGLRDRDAIGVLPRFFYSALVVDEMSRGSRDFRDGFGFQRLALDEEAPGNDGPRNPLVWLPADDREFPLPEAFENRAFERLWLIDFRESEFGVPELSPRVSERVTKYLDAHHRLLERHSFPQLVLSLYVLAHPPEPWHGEDVVLDEKSWRSHARDVSWEIDPQELRYRIDLPTPLHDLDAEIGLDFPGGEDRASAIDATLSVSPYVDTRIALGAVATSIPLRFRASAGQPLVLRMVFPAGRERIPTRVTLRAVDPGASRN